MKHHREAYWDLIMVGAAIIMIVLGLIFGPYQIPVDQAQAYPYPNPYPDLSGPIYMPFATAAE